MQAFRRYDVQPPHHRLSVREFRAACSDMGYAEFADKLYSLLPKTPEGEHVDYYRVVETGHDGLTSHLYMEGLSNHMQMKGLLTALA